jgi:hypothetical protein
VAAAGRTNFLTREVAEVWTVIIAAADLLPAPRYQDVTNFRLQIVDFKFISELQI